MGLSIYLLLKNFIKKYGSKIETYKVEIDELEKSLKRLEPIQVKKRKSNGISEEDIR